MRTAAFFDLDRTLIDVNSGLLWAKYEQRRGNISRYQLMKAAFWTGMYHLSLIDMETVLTKAIIHYKGLPWDSLNQRTREWFHREVEPRLRPKAKAALAKHRQAGHPLVLLTNSSCFEAAAVADTWNLDAWLANHFPTDEQGCLLGTFAPPMCYGAGKVVAAEQWAAENDVDLGASFYYGDSYSDRQMLERVGEPRVVAPDPRLRRLAKQRGWQILDW